MDAISFFLLRYGDIHGSLIDGLFARLPEAHLRGRPHAGVIPVPTSRRARTLEVIQTLRGSDLEALVPAERVRSVVLSEGVVARGAEWLAEFWAGGRSRAWVLAQTALLHPNGHYYEARVAAGLWGARSP